LERYKGEKAMTTQNTNTGDNTGDQNNITISKEEYSKLQETATKAQKDLEDMRLEFLSDDYLKFLNNKENTSQNNDGTKPNENGKDGKKPEDTSTLDDELKGLTPKQIYELATKRAAEHSKSEVDKLREEIKNESSTRTRNEVVKFAKSHADFETYRPIMYGLSLDPKNADLNLTELYELAKVHVSRIHTEPTEQEKNRQRKLSGEKPGSSSYSFQKSEKISASQAAAEAAREVEEALGPLPTI
jgi:hypothetical protein